MAKAKSKAKTADKKKKNIKEVEIEEVIEEIEEFDDEEFDFVDEDDFEEEVETPKKKKASKVVLDDEEDEVVELTMEERIIGIEKKQNIILVFVLVTALLSLFTFISGLGGNKTYKDEETEPTNTETQQATAYDTSAFTKVKAQDLEKLSKKDTIIVWIGRQGCGYCGQFAPTITSVGEKLDETIYYLDLADIFDFSTNPVTILDEEAYDLLLNFKTDGATENKEVMKEFGATPMTLVIKKNKIVGNFVGAYDEATALEILEDEGFKQK
jgi:predicted bacteriocin transport accessory protein